MIIETYIILWDVVSFQVNTPQKYYYVKM